jgi:hypothetical protein
VHDQRPSPRRSERWRLTGLTPFTPDVNMYRRGAHGAFEVRPGVMAHPLSRTRRSLDYTFTDIFRSTTSVLHHSTVVVDLVILLEIYM